LVLPQLASAYAIGTHTFTAVYSGGGSIAGSTSPPYAQVVAPPVYFTEGFGAFFDIVNSVTGNGGARIANPSSICNCTTSNSLAVSPDGTRAYVLSTTFLGDATLTVFNTQTATVSAIYQLPADYIDLAMSPDGSTVYLLGFLPHVEISAFSTAGGDVTGTVPSHRRWRSTRLAPSSQ
jgi:DNA-binding beta-propeller fold protein YncE